MSLHLSPCHLAKLPSDVSIPQCGQQRRIRFVGLGRRATSWLHCPPMHTPHLFDLFTRPLMRLLISWASSPVSDLSSYCVAVKEVLSSMLTTLYSVASFGPSIWGRTLPLRARLIAALAFSDFGTPLMGDGLPRSGLGSPLARRVSAPFLPLADRSSVDAQTFSAAARIFSLVASECSPVRKNGFPFEWTKRLMTAARPWRLMASAIMSCSSRNTSSAALPGRSNISQVQHSLPSSSIIAATTFEDVKYVVQKESGETPCPKRLPIYNRPVGTWVSL